MKYDTQTLLLADAVRAMAKEKRGTAQRKASEQAHGTYRAGNPTRTDDQHNAALDFQEDWLAKNPLSAFVTEALEELEAIADLMKHRP